MPAGQAGQRVIVTGAAGGIGYACARLLLAEGHRVAAVDLQTIPRDLAAGSDDGRLLRSKADVANADDCRSVVARCVEAYGGVDALIHMAAVHSSRTASELDAAEFNRVLSVNVTGSFLMAQAAAGHMAAHGGGAIVLAGSGSMNVGGIGGHGRGGPAYVTSKAAIIGLTRSLARSYGPRGIRVNAISPGATATPMTSDYDEEAMRSVAARTLAGRIGTPEEIAAVACFLISDAASYIIGEIVQVNGGGSFA